MIQKKIASLRITNVYRSLRERMRDTLRIYLERRKGITYDGDLLITPAFTAWCDAMASRSLLDIWKKTGQPVREDMDIVCRDGITYHLTNVVQVADNLAMQRESYSLNITFDYDSLNDEEES